MHLICVLATNFRTVGYFYLISHSLPIFVDFPTNSCPPQQQPTKNIQKSQDYLNSSRFFIQHMSLTARIPSHPVIVVIRLYSVVWADHPKLPGYLMIRSLPRGFERPFGREFHKKRGVSLKKTTANSIRLSQKEI